MLPGTTAPAIAVAVPFAARPPRPGLRGCPGCPFPNNPELNARFIAEDRILTLRNVRILCWIAMALMLSAVVLDWFAYPQLLAEFFTYRLVCAVCLMPILLFSRTWIAHKYYRALTVVVPMLPAFFISLMIKDAHDPGSGYYAGLTLCLVAIGFMFHWTFVESLVALCITICFYLCANAWVLWEGVPPSRFGAFVNNGVFILLNGVVIICGSFYHHRIRVREFLNRIEVEQQREELATRNSELTTTLKQLRETESQLVQSEKLASLGRMSAGIIHEINNPLSFANQALFVLKKKGNLLPEETRPHFERIISDIKEGIGRVSSIVSDLRSFSHPEAGPHTLVNLDDVVQNSTRLIANNTRDSGVTIQTDCDPGVHIAGDRNHLIQILINLIQNAIDALRGSANPEIHIRVFVIDGQPRLAVSDNGCGIARENLDRIFDPFFTTKPVGAGMGLGLSICYRLMLQMKGIIEVTSEPDKGTTFTLRFPSLAPPAPVT